MSSFWETKIEFLKGVGPTKSALLQTELNLFTYGDLIQHYPFRYLDRTQIYPIGEVHEELPMIQVRGTVLGKEVLGEGRKQRLVATLADASGEIKLTWFQGVKWMQSKVMAGTEYIAFGKPLLFGHTIQMTHPDLELVSEVKEQKGFLQPVYSTTQKLSAHQLDSKGIARIMEKLLELAKPHLHETLSADLLDRYKLISKREALLNIHFPQTVELEQKARLRLKFEELFYVQLRLLRQKTIRKKELPGQLLTNTDLLTEFYKNHLPFELTDAQKRVIREIFVDLKTGKQMNRLLQGDVGSGKTIVAFITALLAIGSGAQACLMAPTEILADQHFQGLKEHAEKLGLPIGKLTGSTKKRERNVLHEQLRSGELKLLVGTHALLEDEVQFQNLGLCIIDEQHRFGVEQRSRLWKKNPRVIPHVLVMTATPIPRTLAMTLYGDLDVSVIDELPKGRKEIITVHRFDNKRVRVFGFLREQINLGRQVYIVYPLIEESEKMEVQLKDLTDGYESITRYFPEFHVSMVHGKMTPQAKDFEMQRFVRGETQIMVATTVIEVGVNVPNASVMVIENAERFGLAQLHQLRGRVGRGADQSYCILMSDYRLSKEGKTRLETMCRTNNGFEIANINLKLRGPGDLMGTQQSGVLDLLIADLAKDGRLLAETRAVAQELLDDDPALEKPGNAPIQRHIASLKKSTVNWSRIS